MDVVDECLLRCAPGATRGTGRKGPSPKAQTASGHRAPLPRSSCCAPAAARSPGCPASGLPWRLQGSSFFQCCARAATRLGRAAARAPGFRATAAAVAGLPGRSRHQCASPARVGAAVRLALLDRGPAPSPHPPGNPRGGLRLSALSSIRVGSCRGPLRLVRRVLADPGPPRRAIGHVPAGWHPPQGKADAQPEADGSPPPQ